MFRRGQICRPVLLAVATVALAMWVALRSSDWGQEIVDRVIERPLTEVLRLTW